MSGRSLSWGESFEKSVQVSDNGVTSYKGLPYIGVAPNGDVYAVWLDERDNICPNADSSSVYFAKSVNHGATFGQTVCVGKKACPCCRTSLAFGPHGEVFVAWRRVFPGEIRDLVVSASHDCGLTFAESVRVHDDDWKLKGCPDCGATLAEANGILYVAWMTEGTDERPRIEFAHSDNGAKSFSQPVDISNGILDPNHPTFKISGDGTLWIAFQGRAPSSNANWSETQAYIAEAGCSGRPSQPIPIPGSDNSISYPTIGLGSGGRIFLAWTQQQGAHHLVMLSRGRTTL